MLETFLQTLMDAVAVGSLYALIALGYTMVYGILKFINFAHSDVFVLGRRRVKGEPLQAVFQDIKHLMVLTFPGQSGAMA